MSQSKFIWSGHSGSSDFAASGNWLDGTGADTSLVPGAADAAFVFGTEYVTGTASIADLTTALTNNELGFVFDGTMSVSDIASFQGNAFLIGGSIAVANSIDIGRNGTTASVLLMNDASLGAASGSTPYLYVGTSGGQGKLGLIGTGAAVNVRSVEMGVAPGGAGAVYASDGATLHSSVTLMGLDDATSLLQLTSGSSYSTNFLVAGDTSSATATIGVYGFSSLTANTIELDGGTSGTTGSSTLDVALATVTDASSLSLATGATLIGRVGSLINVGSIASLGTISLTDAATQLVVQGSFQDDGLLNVSGGATLVSQNTDPGNNFSGALIVASTGGSSGTANVAGGSAILSEGFVVGEQGSGTLTVSQAGTVQVTGAYGHSALGGFSTGQGVLNITGAGSLVEQMGGGFVVGYLGTGALNILAGGGANVSTLQVSASSTLTVDGAGSRLTSDRFSLDSGSVATISGGGTVSVSVLLSSGAITLQNGDISSGSLLTVDGSIVGNGAIDSGSLNVDGTIEASGGLLAISAPISGAGSLQIDSGATLSLTGGTVAPSIAFLAGGTLDVATPTLLSDIIGGWTTGDVIEFTNIAATSSSFSAGTLTLDGSSGDVLGSLVFSGTNNAGNFVLSSDHAGGTDITFHS